MTRRLTVLAAALALLLASCTSEPRATPTAPTVEPSPTATARAAATPAATTIAPSATPTSSPRDIPPFAAYVIDAASGQTTVLYEGEGPWRSADVFRPALTPDREAVWVSVQPDRATRYFLDGSVAETVDGWAVVESADGTSRAYFQGTRQGASLLVERDGSRHVIEITDSNWVGPRVISPDGRLLAYQEFTGEDLRLVVYDIESDTASMTVEGISSCECDGPDYLSWSPSGRYLVYENPDPFGTGGRDHGKFILEVETGRRVAVSRADRVPNYWIHSGDDELLVSAADGDAVVTSASSGEQRLLAAEVNGWDLAVTGKYAVIVTGADEQHTLIVDAVTGAHARELEGRAEVQALDDGLAIARYVVDRYQTCSAIALEKPGYEYEWRGRCDGATARWSPDGRYLALSPRGLDNPMRILDTETNTEITVRMTVPAVPTWGADGRHLLYAWGGGV